MCGAEEQWGKERWTRWTKELAGARHCEALYSDRRICKRRVTYPADGGTTGVFAEGTCFSVGRAHSRLYLSVSVLSLQRKGGSHCHLVITRLR